jgi:hypothetical protein
MGILTEVLNDIRMVEILEELDLALEGGDSRDLTGVGSIGSGFEHLDLLDSDHFACGRVETEVDATVLEEHGRKLSALELSDRGERGREKERTAPLPIKSPLTHLKVTIGRSIQSAS